MCKQDKDLKTFDFIEAIIAWLWLELYNMAMHRQVQAQPLVLIVSFNNVMLNHQSVLKVWNEEKIKKSFLIQKTEQKDITRKLVGGFQ